MPDPAHTVETHRHLRAFVDELVRCGMREACTSPGSRNTPIVLSLARDERLRCFSHIDERCAGFFAVGAAKAGGRPVAVTCTSGTAAAELTPAVVEAHWARVPLIVLTADRPAQLRDVGAGQAIDQFKLYGDAVKWFSEVELPPRLTAASMRWVRQLACRAYWTALDGRPGPVQLNVPLREPLVLSEPLGPETEFPGRPDGRPWLRAGAQPVAARTGHVPSSLGPRPLIVAGRVEHDAGLQHELTALAQRVGAPVLADALSQARTGPTAIATYDLLLRDSAFAARLTPTSILRVGDLPTSKPLRTWLASMASGAPQILVDPEATWQDPDAVAEQLIAGDAAAALAAFAAADPPDAGWLRAWTDADETVSTALEAGLAADGTLSEPLVARRLGEWLSPETTLFVAASMPIRDVELYLLAGGPLPRVLSNRGANGIDGTISSAFGAAAADPGRPIVLLIGDVALLHDLGGLIAARRLGLALTIVVINNDGGGIFHFLAVSGEGDAFEEHVATPHGLSLQRVAALFELEHVTARTEAELRAALTRSVDTNVNAAAGTRAGASTNAVTLIEVRTDREENLALHRTLADAGLASLGER